MEYFLGVDGGGTHTRSLVVSEDLSVIGSGLAGPADILSMGKDSVRNNLVHAIEASLASVNISIEQIVSSCFGMPTYLDGVGTDEAINSLIKKVFPGLTVIVNDVQLALEASFPMKSGAIMLSGTGAMLMFRNASNEIHRIDGWGELAGDMGSGYYIGLKALQTAFKQFDGRIKNKKLLEAIMREIGVFDITEVINHSFNGSRKLVASLSKIVCSVANEEDAISKALLEDATNELLITIFAVKDLTDSLPIEIALSGGVFKCSYLRERVEKTILADKDLKLVNSEFDNIWGAIFLAISNVKDRRFLQDFIDKLRSLSAHHK